MNIKHISLTSLAIACTTMSFTSTANPLDRTTFNFSGYIKADAMVSQYSDGTLSSGSIGRDFYIPSLTPTGGEKESAQFDAHIKQSRFRFTTNTLLSNDDKITGVLEFDFHTTPDGNERISNSYEPRIRHAFLKYNNWLIGQTWSTFQDVKTLPESLDFIGVTDGTIFARQTMLKYTSGAFEVSLENPETTVTPFGGGGRIVADDNSVPDLAARYTLNQSWGHVSVAGLVRQLAYEDKQNGNDIDTSEVGYGLSITSKIKFGEDDVRIMANIGSGLGRYIALNASNGAVLDANNKLDVIDVRGFTIAYRHLWDEKWRSTFSYAMFSADNDTDLTGLEVIKETYSARANILYSPAPELTFGAEYAYAEKTLESDVDGDMSRLQFSATYAF
ncbi:DcaP family trimeric outer membrane transporter [Paraglaciecola sp. 20A4]|uniref:DcaP family trimeric outer membrane transporter n=1 Tax=Paraglaciecola sp. 20A4 TaxID=2687288 RepID=UPI001409FA6A|nr:DcaP family trimeric outer membrane transporter [Paraglaciecola sp. 20A4]